jgi:hypothetical protein
MKTLITLTMAFTLGLSGLCSAPALAQDLDQAVQKLLDDHRAIAQAYAAYFAKHGSKAENVAALVADGQLAGAPAPDCNALANCTAETRYEIGNWGDNDGNGTPDLVVDIIDGGLPTFDLCLSFNSKNTTLGNKAFRNAALGGGSPSPWPETEQSFCVCWTEGCDVDASTLLPGQSNIITLLSH